MKPFFFIFIIAIALVLGISFWQSQQPRSEPPTPIAVESTVVQAEDPITIRIQDFRYVPDTVIVKKGTTVTWINEDDMEHNVMKDHEDSANPHEAVETADPSIFEGPMMAPGERYSFTFQSAGDNPYHCSPHPWMKGNVTVTE